MKKSNNASVFSPKVFVIHFFAFMLFINVLFFFHGTVFGRGYSFDMQAFVIDQLPTAIICSIAAGLLMKH